MSDENQRATTDHQCEHPGCNATAYRGYTTLGVPPEQFKLHWLCDPHWLDWHSKQSVKPPTRPELRNEDRPDADRA